MSADSTRKRDVQDDDEKEKGKEGACYLVGTLLLFSELFFCFPLRTDEEAVHAFVRAHCTSAQRRRPKEKWKPRKLNQTDSLLFKANGCSITWGAIQGRKPRAIGRRTTETESDS